MRGQSHVHTQTAIDWAALGPSVAQRDARLKAVCRFAIRGQVAIPEVFVNARGEPLSRWGFAYLLKQHVAMAAQQHPGLAKKRVSPHVLRHTCAMIVLQATQDIRKVSLWLGHATMTTTEVYTRGDPTEKLDAMEAIVPPHLRRGTFQPTDKLIALLKRAP